MLRELATDLERAEDRHAWIGQRMRAAANFGVQIRAASIAQPATRVCAQWTGWQRQHGLFADKRRQIDLFLRIKAQAKLFTAQLSHSSFRFAWLRQQKQIELAVQAQNIIIQTTPAARGDFAGQPPVKKNFLA